MTDNDAEFAAWADHMVRKPDDDLVQISRKNLRRIHDRNIELQKRINDLEIKYCL